MFYNNDRNQIRQFYFDTWHQYQSKQLLSPLEEQIIQVILAHPEYHSILNKKKHEQDFSEEMDQHNPFMHMGLHLAIRDQAQLNQPLGIAEVFQAQLAKGLDKHAVEHCFIDVLAGFMWQATSMNQPLDMAAYLEALKNI